MTPEQDEGGYEYGDVHVCDGEACACDRHLLCPKCDGITVEHTLRLCRSQKEQIERLTLELEAERARQQGLIAKWRADAATAHDRTWVAARTKCADELESAS
jgi:hypothetical protein